MPACFARSASSSPTLRALALLSPLVPFLATSRADASGRGLPRVAPDETARACERPGLRSSHDLLTSLPDLAADDLALVPHALALVRVGLAELANSRGDLADQLLVDALDHEPGGGLNPEGDALRRGDHHRVAEAERELQVLAPSLHAVADPDDLERLLVALGDAGDHVGDQRPGQAVQRAHRAVVTGPGDPDDTVLLDHVDRLRDDVAEASLRALHLHAAAVDGDVDAAGNGDGEPSDPRHL